MECEKTPNGHGKSRQENHCGGSTMPDFTLCHEAVTGKTVGYWHKNRHADQWNRREHPEVDPQLSGQLIFSQAGKTMHGEKEKTVSSINAAGNTGQPHAEE